MSDPLSAKLRARIAARWPSSSAFYAERDDRTVRVVAELHTHANRSVEILVDPDASSDATVQRIALVAANLTARWARHVRVITPLQEPLTIVLRRDGRTTLAKRLEFEMAMADPFGDFAVVREPASVAGVLPLRLFVGPWYGRHAMFHIDDYNVHAVGWTALGRRGGVVQSSSETLRATASAAAAGLAGALGAADLFKRAIGHARSNWMPTFSWDTWSSELHRGAASWSVIEGRAVPATLNLGHMLLAGVGAIGSAFVYLADLMPLTGDLTLFDCDNIDITNLNRSPLFTVEHALDEEAKTDAAAAYCSRHVLRTTRVSGMWREHASALADRAYDVWISLTNEDGAWAEVPFQLPPIVLHGTTTSGWGFGTGRHIPRLEDCTLCRMPRPAAEFRGPCADGSVASTLDGKEIRASLPFLSTASAALTLASYLQLECGANTATNDVSVDLGAGLPAVVALARGPTAGCRGCRAAQSRVWAERGGRGRYARLSTVGSAA
jgi:hypothetical protein